MKKKKLLSIILAIVMVFTFSFGSVGIYANDDEVQTASEHNYEITAVHWNDDYTAAFFDVRCMDEGCGHTDTIEAEVLSEYNDIIYTSTAKTDYPLAAGIENNPVSVLNLNTATVDFNMPNQSKTNFTDGNQLLAPGFDITNCISKISVVDINDNKTIHEVNNSPLIKASAIEYTAYADGIYETIISAAADTGTIKVIGNCSTDITVKTTQMKQEFLNIEVSNLDHFDTHFKYDGLEHIISITNPGVETTYAVPKEGDKELTYTSTAPIIKNAGKYEIYFYVNLKGTSNYEKFTRTFVIHRVDATIEPCATVNKVYDENGFELEKGIFKIIGVQQDEVLVSGVEETGADVGAYKIYPVIDKEIAKNYKVNIKEPGYTIGEIEKADNFVSITKSKYKIKKGNSAVIKTQTNFGTPKFKKVSGNSKIKVSDDGTIKVKKSTKKGTYKVKVKAIVEKSKNYNADSISRKLTIVVK